MLREVDRSDRPFSWIPRFWARRWLRTLPNYFLFLALNAAIAGNIRPADLTHALSYLFFMQNLSWPPRSFFIESWSLSVEEIFYLVTPLVVATAWAMGATRRNSILLTAATIVLISTSARIVAAKWLGLSFTDIRTIVVLRLDAIMVGVLLAGIASAGSMAASRIRIGAVALLPLFALAAWISGLPDGALNASLTAKVGLFPLASVGCAALILTGSSSLKHVPRYLDSITSRVARWSYSAYLVNVPLLAGLHALAPVPNGAAGCISMWLSYFTGTFLISSAIYRIYERPLLRWRDRMTFAES